MIIKNLKGFFSLSLSIVYTKWKQASVHNNGRWDGWWGREWKKLKFLFLLILITVVCICPLRISMKWAFSPSVTFTRTFFIHLLPTHRQRLLFFPSFIPPTTFALCERSYDVDFNAQGLNVNFSFLSLSLCFVSMQNADRRFFYFSCLLAWCHLYVEVGEERAFHSHFASFIYTFAVYTYFFAILKMT